MCDWVFAISLAPSSTPLQVISGSPTEENLQTTQVICRGMERTKWPGDKRVS